MFGEAPEWTFWAMTGLLACVNSGFVFGHDLPLILRPPGIRVGQAAEASRIVNRHGLACDVGIVHDVDTACCPSLPCHSQGATAARLASVYGAPSQARRGSIRRGATIHESPGSRPLHVAGFDLIDLESRHADQFVHLTIEVAAPAESSPAWR